MRQAMQANIYPARILKKIPEQKYLTIMKIHGMKMTPCSYITLVIHLKKKYSKMGVQRIVSIMVTGQTGINSISLLAHE
ncbi:unnamed protein product, partial [Iphiclides podalirius]